MKKHIIKIDSKECAEEFKKLLSELDASPLQVVSDNYYESEENDDVYEGMKIGFSAARIISNMTFTERLKYFETTQLDFILEDWACNFEKLIAALVEHSFDAGDRVQDSTNGVYYVLKDYIADNRILVIDTNFVKKKISRFDLTFSEE